MGRSQAGIALDLAGGAAEFYRQIRTELIKDSSSPQSLPGNR